MPQLEIGTKPKEAPQPPSAPLAPHQKTLTNWKNFAEAGLAPSRLKCESYLGSHPAELSCHTALVVSKDTILNHMDPEHGGGWFKMRFRSVEDGSPALKIWQDLDEAGVEIQHLYCPHCRETLDARVAPQEVVNHLRPHAGANRVNQEPQTLCMTLELHSVAQRKREEMLNDEI